MKKVLFFLLLAVSAQLSAQDCLLDFDYFREITIENTGPTALTDHQILLVVNTGDLVTAGKLNADGSDLRFTLEDCTLLPYYMDSLATSTANHIWVKVPMVPAGGETVIRAYYGNPDAEPYANGDDVFIFFDDFASGVVDPAKWEAVGSYATLEVVDGILNYASDGANPGPRFKFVRTAASFEEPVLFDFAAEITNSNGFGFSSADVALDRILFRQSVFGFDTLNQVALMQDTFDNGFQVEGLYPVIRWPRFEMQAGVIAAGINGDDNLQLNLFANQSVPSVSTDTYILESVEMSGFHFIISSFLSAQTVYLDYLRVRKPTPVAPDIAVGPEMENADPTGISSLLPENAIQLSPNPTDGLLMVQNSLAVSGELWIIDGLGRNLYTQRINLPANGQTAINLTELPAGIYHLVISGSTGNLLFTDRIAVSR